jgi:hypothetical protein
MVVPFAVSHLATKEGRPGVSTRILKGGAAERMGVICWVSLLLALKLNITYLSESPSRTIH